MNRKHFTNKEIWSTDFASKERIVFLRSAGIAQSTGRANQVRNISTASIWNADVTGMDRRAIKAQLMGRGDYRATWWNLNCLFHRFFYPNDTLEQIMVSFHRRHHALTLLRLELIHDYWRIYYAIREDGLVAGIRCAIHQAIAGART